MNKMERVVKVVVEERSDFHELIYHVGSSY